MDSYEKGDREEDGSPPSRRVAEAPVTPHQQPEEEAPEENTPERKDRGGHQDATILGFPALDVLQAFFNLVLMVTAVVGSIVIYRQLEIMEEQMAESKRTSQAQDQVTARSLAALEKQAKAMTELAESNGRTVAMLYRAHISVGVNSDPIEPINASHPSFQSIPLRATIHLGNDRTLPARNVRLDAAADVLPHNSVPRSDRLRPLRKGGTMIGDQALTADFRYTNGSRVGAVTLPLITNLREGRVDLRVYGTVKYSDEFGSCYWRKFCFVYGVPSMSYESIGWRPCPGEQNDEGERQCEPKEVSATKQPPQPVTPPQK